MDRAFHFSPRPSVTLQAFLSMTRDFEMGFPDWFIQFLNVRETASTLGLQSLTWRAIVFAQATVFLFSSDVFCFSRHMDGSIVAGQWRAGPLRDATILAKHYR